jgi:UDP-2,4-diacetamido-2,4,6-trideoxy-beta-L-altropyranose hydrolase
MQVAFRVDASPQIGTGHLARCLTLADALRGAGARTRLVARHIPSGLADTVRSKGHELKMLPGDAAPADAGLAHAAWLGTSQAADARATQAALADEAWDWLVVDHYALDAQWEDRLRPIAHKILALDDLADRPHACDALLDQNLQPAGTERYRGLVPDACRMLVGPRYALLRPEFRDITVPDRVGEVRRINIFFGGIDAAGMTLRALNELEALPARGIALEVVAGAGNPNLESIRARCAALNATLHIQTQEIARLFAAAGLAIGAGGATSWERCRMGLSSLVVSVADNQRSGCLALEQAGAAIFLGDSEALTPGAVRDGVEKMMADTGARLAMAQRCAALVDGRGTERALLYMMRARTALRPADAGDARRAWSWRNHPETRRFSHASDELAWEDHHDWWQSSLGAPDRDLLIAHCGGIDFGILRFDRHDNAATVSIYLDPDLGGLGLGSAVLRAGHDWIGRNSAIKTLDARILRSNEQSRRSFAAAGYRQADGPSGGETWARPVVRGMEEVHG